MLFHVGQAAPQQLDSGIVLGYHRVSLRDLLPQSQDVDLKVFALAFQRQKLQNHSSDRVRPFVKSGIY